MPNGSRGAISGARNGSSWSVLQLLEGHDKVPRVKLKLYD
jgi:hypothetical protein